MRKVEFVAYYSPLFPIVDNENLNSLTMFDSQNAPRWEIWISNSIPEWECHGDPQKWHRKITSPSKPKKHKVVGNYHWPWI